ncbi:alpha/beta hydrolase family protein [Sulfitobacter sabulilitoris]|uniref:Dienelactone hydrolase n=1 Tax=Sulfitobacter sabulilitoris TaxID=2562655 RepID=A0A5S3PBM4_9RHOB|nr:alpha/beta fold hydrolase [Sulfitobacter sabulilitoris]TMM50885.1 dienelactone hydrolase [Sulfitobacter sabulilitoris]
MTQIKTLATAATLGSLMALPALSNPIDLVRPDAPELAPFGTLPIGVQTMEFTHPGQIDILNTTEGNAPSYDRKLTVEVWYPAADGTEPGGEYTAFLRDGATEVTLTGRAARDAAPASGASYPLIVISHGYPGNRYLMSHLGENLASKGYVTVSIDHTDSTYSDQAAFGSTLLNRPIDQRFVIDQMAAMDGDLGAIIDGDVVGVIGYSMGGYGALIFGGAGVTQASTEYSWGTPNGLLARHLAGSDTHEALIDDRVKAIIAIGPWGKNAGFWDTEGLSGLRKPTLLMAGGSDDVSVYAAIRSIFEEARGTDRHLLTFDHANHNAAAPMPAPKEAWQPVDTLDFVPFEHYADAVWDTTRMNNIAQHFATAFMGLHLKGDTGMRPYFDLIEDANNGVIALDEEANPTDDHTYWTGFAPRTAAGLRFETQPKGE